jgi:hypothetical protein
MYSNVLMAFNNPLEDIFRESGNILYGKHQAMYPRDLQVDDCVIVGSLLDSHKDIQCKRLMEFLSQLSGNHTMTPWKAVDDKPEEGKE